MRTAARGHFHHSHAEQFRNPLVPMVWNTMGCDGDNETGLLTSVEWSLFWVVFLCSSPPPCRLFVSFPFWFPHFGLWIRGPLFFQPSHLSPRHHRSVLTVVVFCFPVLPPLYIIRSAVLYMSVAPSHAYGCLSITVQACYFLYMSLILSFVTELLHSTR